MLDTTVESVTSALKRARATLQARTAAGTDREPAPRAGSRGEEAIVAKFIDAWESADINALVGLLTDDVFMSRPPMPFEYEGPDLVGRSAPASSALDAGSTSSPPAPTDSRPRCLPSRSRRDPARRGPLRPWPQRAANLPADPIREQHASPVRVATITTQPMAVRPNWSNPGAVDTGPASDRKCRMGWRALSHLARPAPLATRARVSPMRPCHWQQVAGGGRPDVPEIGALRAAIHARAGNQ
jgi:hypothetical protein